jgi:glutathione S-transferase
MHSGFRDLRMAMPMNCGRTDPGRDVSPASLADIRRIVALWLETRTLFGAGGAYLFGATLTGADIMFAPVVSRFLSYRPELPSVAEQYVAAVRAHPLMVAWYDAATAEPVSWLIEKYEVDS